MLVVLVLLVDLVHHGLVLRAQREGERALEHPGHVGLHEVTRGGPVVSDGAGRPQYEAEVFGIEVAPDVRGGLTDAGDGGAHLVRRRANQDDGAVGNLASQGQDARAAACDVDRHGSGLGPIQLGVARAHVDRLAT